MLSCDSYNDEWAEDVNNPELRAKFKQFANTDETIEKEKEKEKDAMIEFVYIREQTGGYRFQCIDFVEAKKGRMDAQLFMTDYHGGFQRDSNVFSIE